MALSIAGGYDHWTIVDQRIVGVVNIGSKGVDVVKLREIDRGGRLRRKDF